MKSTLSPKKSLSAEKQAKISQITGIKVESMKEKPPDNQNFLEHSQKKKHPLISIKELVKAYPKCFDFKNPKLLKKGIMQEILEQGLWTESKTSLREALAFYVGSPLYHQTILEETFRYDLEEKRAEEIKESEREYAKRKIGKNDNTKLIPIISTLRRQ